MVLICNSLMINDAEYLLMYLMDHLYVLSFFSQIVRAFGYWVV